MTPVAARGTERTLDDPRLLLDLWEEAAAVPPCAVGAVLLHHAGIIDDPVEVLDLPLSQVATLLARVWTSTFGPTADCLIDCPQCGEDLELVLPLEELAALPELDSSGSVGSSGLVVRFPATRDLLAVTAASDPAHELLRRCLADADGRAVDPAGLSADLRMDVEATTQRLAGAAAAVVTTVCPACGAPVRVDVDPGEILWQRLRAAVPAVLADVTDLAAAFGWSEADVLALSPARRAAYLDLVRDRP